MTSTLPEPRTESQAETDQKPKLTIAIATINDHEGLWWTVQILKWFHAEDLADCELLVIDQDPDSDQGKENQKFAIKKIKRRAKIFQNVKYVPMRHPKGIGPARNRIFAEASGEAVLALDSHVLLPAGVVRRLLDYYAENPGCRDLLVGPLASDADGFVGTHQEMNWRSEAWGTWARDKELYDADADPKEVPMQGLGLFSCRVDAFPGFHPAQQGFGCAEAVFCEKFRKRGDRVLCVPGLQWVHRFFRFGGAPYPVFLVDKIANYLIEMTAEGMDTTELLDHFEGRLNDADMMQLQERLAEAESNDQIPRTNDQGDDDGSGQTEPKRAA